MALIDLDIFSYMTVGRDDFMYDDSIRLSRHFDTLDKEI